MRKNISKKSQQLCNVTKSFAASFSEKHYGHKNKLLAFFQGKKDCLKKLKIVSK